MIDLIFLSHNRREFTEACLQNLIRNTNWERVNRLILYDDNSTDGTRELVAGMKYPIMPHFRIGKFGSPVQVMNEFLTERRGTDPQIFAKIDSDTMVPSGWLDECLAVMSDEPQLDFLGIEAFNPVVEKHEGHRSYTQARFIGGIGLMRPAAFTSLPWPNGRFGFTEWQERNSESKKGWIAPSLPVFLLDHLPREPWATLSKKYIENGWQRQWEAYPEESRDLWSWWVQ
jgi:hypothetical protein